jgi:hypothetical protein
MLHLVNSKAFPSNFLITLFCQVPKSRSHSKEAKSQQSIARLFLFLIVDHLRELCYYTGGVVGVWILDFLD